MTEPSPEKKHRAVRFILLVALAAALGHAVFHRFGVRAGDYWKFSAGFLALVYIPGQSAVWLLGIRVSRLESLISSLALGMSLATLVNKWARMFRLEIVFWIWLAFSLLYFVHHLVKKPPKSGDFSFGVTRTGIGLSAILLLALGVLYVDNFRNGLSRPDGSVVVNMHYYDGFIRNAVVRETAHSVPPQMPFAAGESLGYHYGMDLFAGLFHRYLDLGLFDLIHRFLLAFFFGLFIPAAFIFLREFYRSEPAALWGTFLVTFGSGGLTYLLCAAFKAPLGGNIFRSLYFFDFLAVNSLVPALALFFLGFWSLIRYLALRRTSWLFLTALFFGSAAEFKVFLIGPAVGALFLAGAVSWAKFRDAGLFRLSLTTAAVSLVLLAPILAGRSGSVPYTFKIQVTDWIAKSLHELNVPALTSAWTGLVSGGDLTAGNFFLSLAAIALFLLGSFGLSLLAFPSAASAVFKPKRGEEARTCLGFFSILGVGAFFGFSIYLGKLPRNMLTCYVYYAGLIAVIIFWAERVSRWAAGKKTAARLALFAAVGALSIPNSAWFVRNKVLSPEPRVFSRSFLEAADWIRNNTPPHAVVLQPEDLRYTCYFSGRRAVLENSVHSYLSFHLPPRKIASRRKDISRFFGRPEANGDVLRKYGVSVIWVMNSPGRLGGGNAPVVSFPPGRAEGRTAPGGSFLLEPVFLNDEYALYGVRALPGDEGEAAEMIISRESVSGPAN